MSDQLLCQIAFGLATVSILLSTASVIATRPGKVESIPAPDPKTPSLKLTRVELLEHARALGIGTATWRNSARKVHLLEAIRQHNIERRSLSA